MRDIANANFPQRKLTIHCWPSTDSLDRLWGHYGRERDQAAIMHFRMQANPEGDLKILNFELSITFKVIEPSGTEGEPGVVALINNPCPDTIEAPARSGSILQRDRAPWRFCSQVIGNPSPGAMWSWKSNVYETPILHGGVAVLHSGNPFFGRCRVRGEVKRSRRTFKFDNIHHGEKVFRVEPEAVDLCLDEHVRNLNKEVKARFGGYPSTTQSSGTNRSSADDMPTLSPDQNYTSGVIQGSAQVHLGASYITNYNMRPPAQSEHVRPLPHLTQRPVTDLPAEPRLVLS